MSISGNPLTGRRIRTLETGDHEDELEWAFVAISPDGGRIVAGSRRGELSVWNTKGDLLEQLLCEHTIAAMVWPNGRNQIALGDDDGAGWVSLWDLDRGECVRSRRVHSGDVLTLAASPDGSRLFSAGLDENAFLLDSQSLETIAPAGSPARGNQEHGALAGWKPADHGGR